MMQLNTKRYFVTGHYSPAGRPKMETELMHRAVTLYLHTIITSRPQMVDYMSKIQEQLLEMNRRWKKASISLHDGVGGISYLGIGESHLTLQEIRENSSL